MKTRSRKATLPSEWDCGAQAKTLLTNISRLHDNWAGAHEAVDQLHESVKEAEDAIGDIRQHMKHIESTLARFGQTGRTKQKRLS